MIIKMHELKIDESLPIEELVKFVAAQHDAEMKVKHIGSYEGHPLFLVYDESSGWTYVQTANDEQDCRGPQALLEDICEMFRSVHRLSPIDIINIGGTLQDVGIQVK